MSTLPIDTLRFQSLTAASTTTTLNAGLYFTTIINNGANSIEIKQSGDAYAVALTIASGQGISFSASSSEVLPQLKIITGSGTTLVSVITN
jgi:hypothetical protein